MYSSAVLYLRTTLLCDVYENFHGDGLTCCVEVVFVWKYVHVEIRLARIGVVVFSSAYHRVWWTEGLRIMQCFESRTMPVLR
jgi:hypothetical protein